MSAPRKKFSGAEYRKKAGERKKIESKISNEMQKWLHGSSKLSGNFKFSIKIPVGFILHLHFKESLRVEPSSQSAINPSSVQSELEENEPTEELHEESAPDLEELLEENAPDLEELLEESEPDLEELLEESELQIVHDAEKMQKEEGTFDLSDPGSWPTQDKITDRQRSFLTKEAFLLSEKQPTNIDFRSTERDHRHLTPSMWYITMKNKQRIKRSWLMYSKARNSIFCAACKLFQKHITANTSALCTVGFTNWKKALERLSVHETSFIHRECMINWKIRMQQMKQCQGIDKEMELLVISEKEKWRQVLRVVIDAVLYLATNCLSFRGSDEGISRITDIPHSSRGNFLNLISLLSKHNSTLKNQLEQIKKGQVSYLSKSIQNELIELLAKTVRSKILDDIKEAKYFTIMFDCTPDASHTEQMSQVIRYVKITGDVCKIEESFVDFIEVTGKTGEYITQQIIDKLKLDELDIGHCRGQSYDNGSNMAGAYKGVQARILELNDLAEFVPCPAHSLNLVGVHSALSCPEAVNMFAVVQKVFCFFVGSTIRWNIMKKLTKTSLKGSSQTRWSAKYQAVSCLLNNLPEVIRSFDEILKTPLNPEAKYETLHLQQAVKKFDFILHLTVWANILREINRVNIEIQKSYILSARSVALTEGLQNTLQKMREKPIEFWIDEAKPIAEHIGIEPILENKRISKRKRLVDELCEDESRSLTSVQILSKTIKVIFDRIISELTTRFVTASTLNSVFGFLNGYKISNLSPEELQKHGADLARKYERDLTAVDFCQELVVFKEQAPLIFKDLKHSSAVCLLQQIYTHDLQDAFPNICIALRIYCTLPTTSSSCERSFSKLKLIKNYLRSTMAQERLTNLAILAIENNTAQSMDYELIIDRFAE